MKVGQNWGVAYLEIKQPTLVGGPWTWGRLFLFMFGLSTRVLWASRGACVFFFQLDERPRSQTEKCANLPAPVVKIAHLTTKHLDTELLEAPPPRYCER